MKKSIVLALFLLGFATNDPDAETGTAREGALTQILTFTGELQAVESATVATPNIPSKWSFVISYLAPEGRRVEPGELLAAFDASDLLLRRLDLEKQREEARLKIAQTEAQQQIQRQDSLLALAAAEKNLRVAELYAQLDPQLIARSETEKYQYDYSNSKVEFEKATQRLENQTAAAKAELEIVRLEFEKADLDLQRVLSELDRMTIRADAPGVVIYADGNEGRKVQVGDSVFKGRPVIELPNMQRLKIVASIFDSDYPELQLGQAAEVVLDAVPDRIFEGRVTRIPDVAKPVERNSEMNLFQVDVELMEADLEVMKPGMTARVRIPVEAGRGLLVSRRALRRQPHHLAFAVRTADNRDVAVRILDANDRFALVDGDLAAGTQLLLDNAAGSANAAGTTQQDWITVKKEDLKFSVSATGVLKAARSVAVGPPPIPNTWQYKIVHLAPEGLQVKEGDLLLKLDPTEVLERLEEEETSLKKVQQEYEKTKASLDLQVKDLELELEEARVNREKTANKLIQAKQFESSMQIREAELEAQLAARRVELLEKKLASTRERTALQLQIFDDSENLHRERMRAARNAIESMTITAPIEGVVIHTPNWNNEKKQIGSQVQLHETVLSLPDLSTLNIRGRVSELDASKIAPGQTVSASIDALPERTFSGKIVRIDNIFRRASFDRPVKVLEVTVELDEIDVRRMRPDMAVRLEVAVDRFDHVIAVPLSVIQSDQEGSYVWVKDGESVEKRRIQPGRDNGIVAVVEAGLIEGDQVLSRAGG